MTSWIGSPRRVGWRVADLAANRTGETVTKSDREIMEILEAYDTTGCAHSAAQLAGCDPKTVRRYVALREAGGGDPLASAAAPRPKMIDAFAEGRGVGGQLQGTDPGRQGCMNALWRWGSSASQLDVRIAQRARQLLD